MRRVLGVLQVLGVAVLVCALLVGALVAGVFLTHPRDEVQFVHYVRKYGDYDGKPRNTAPRTTSSSRPATAPATGSRSGGRRCGVRTTAHSLDGLSDAFKEVAAQR